MQAPPNGSGWLATWTALTTAILLSAPNLASECFLDPSDRTFRESLNGGIGFYCSYGLEPACDNPNRAPSDIGRIQLSRVAGPGLFGSLEDHYYPDGRIKNINHFVRNSVVGRQAFMKLRVSNDDVRKHKFAIAMNGAVVGTIDVEPQPPSGTPDRRDLSPCLPIDTSSVKFARRIPGGTPTPGDNLITVSMVSTPPRSNS